MWSLVCLVLAFVLALLAAWWPAVVPGGYRPHLGWLAVAFYLLSVLLLQVRALH